jgi:biotin carboxylase
MQLARAAGIRAPETAVIESLDGLRAWVALYGLPAVLKADGTCGGRGVRIAGNPQEAEVAFQQLNSPPELLRTVKRSVFDQDWSLLEPCLRRTLPTVNIQRFVPGPDATITVACWQGEVLASIAVEVLKTCKPKGPASVVQLIVNPEMQSAAEILVHRLGLSGLLGFDFVLDQATGTAHLIEMNPRATPTAHLALGTGRDLPAALGAAMLGAALPETESITARDRIALFPSEWLNDSASRWLQCAYHDVPWAEPRLVNLGVKNKLSNGGRLTYDNLNRLTAKYLPRRR